jgi:polyphosphate glucokinase
MKTRHKAQPFTLSIDVGGTGLKASVLNSSGNHAGNTGYMKTPCPCPPSVMIRSLVKLAGPLPLFDRVSVGFPGVVRNGTVITAPHFNDKKWSGYPLALMLEKKWKRPVRLLNDADMQGYAVIKGTGLELVVTLGTGVGTALFRDGALMPRLELAQHPVYGALTYNAYIGDRALKRIGRQKWNARVRQAFVWLNTLLNYDTLYIGGGNSRHLTFSLEKNTHLVPPEAGVLGGIFLWKETT